MSSFYRTLAAIKGKMAMAADSKGGSSEVDIEQGNSTMKDAPGENIKKGEVAMAAKSKAGSSKGDLKREIVNDLNEKMCKLSHRHPSIERVPSYLRNLDPKAYEPKIVSIGPFHHGKKKLQPWEEVKLGTLRYILSLGAANALDIFVKEVFDCLDQARDEYSEKIKFSDNKFANMLVIDGCFIIGVFLGLVNPKETSYVTQFQGAYSLVLRDLRLLENQIPYFVVIKLYNKMAIPDIEGNNDPNFMRQILKKFNLTLPLGVREENVKHILHLYQLSFNPRSVSDENNNRQSIWQRAEEIKRRMPCVTELKEAGVKFKKKTFEENMTGSELKVSFSNGTLEIPLCFVDATKCTMLRNLMAFEQCYEDISQHFTEYCFFMDFLIDSASDVAILQKYGILESLLGSDSQTAQMFNTLTKEVFWDSEKQYMAGVYEEVAKYYKSPCRNRLANLKQKYFKNPWTTISLCVALLLLLFSCTSASIAVVNRFKGCHTRD